MSKDNFGRDITYLRISVTDQCNYRCRYCMPNHHVNFMPSEKLMSPQDIERAVRIATEFGVRHVRLTGGEPLVRPDIIEIIERISKNPAIDDISLTTNGARLRALAPQLKQAGLNRINISLDTLDAPTFKFITQRGNLDEVLDGIFCALEYGFNPVKLNCVVVRSLKQNLQAFVELSVKYPLHVRFIEYMPVGDSGGMQGLGWTDNDTVAFDELLNYLQDICTRNNYGELTPLHKDKILGHGPAQYYTLNNMRGSLGFIAARSNHFCAQCNRMRLTADGALRPCLFSDQEFLLMPYLKSHDDDMLRYTFTRALGLKPEGHEYKEGTQRLMSQIGG